MRDGGWKDCYRGQKGRNLSLLRLFVILHGYIELEMIVQCSLGQTHQKEKFPVLTKNGLFKCCRGRRGYPLWGFGDDEPLPSAFTIHPGWRITISFHCNPPGNCKDLEKSPHHNHSILYYTPISIINAIPCHRTFPKNRPPLQKTCSRW